MSARNARPALLQLAACLLLVTGAPAPVPAVQAPATGTRDAAPSSLVDRAALMTDLQALAAPELEGRRTGSAGNREARRLIVAAFTSAGLEPAGTDGYLQPFRATPGGTREQRAAETARHEAANVVGRLPGTADGSPAFVVTAHYDHLGVRNGRVHPGADDNASGVAVLIAAARWFAANPPRHPMIFAALDAEEIGLQGAEHFVAHPPIPLERIALNVNLDMVSRSARRELYVAGTYRNPALRPILEDLRGRSALSVRFGHDRPGGSGTSDWTGLSDHAAFHRRGIPFVYFGVEDHEDYHRPTDTADRVDPVFFGDAADTILEGLRLLDARHLVPASR